MKITETNRLLIREIHCDDVEGLRGVLSDPEVMKYSFRGICSTEDIENYINDCLSNYATYGFGQWAVVEKKNSKLIGVCGPNPGFDGDSKTIHIASRFAVGYWGKGFASEALVATIEYAKTRLNLNVIYALIEPDNVKSVKLVLNCGFEFQKNTLYKGKSLCYYRKLV